MAALLFCVGVEEHSQEWLCHRDLVVAVDAVAGLDLGVFLFHG
jgi:hypothetical protein